MICSRWPPSVLLKLQLLPYKYISGSHKQTPAGQVQEMSAIGGVLMESRIVLGARLVPGIN